MANTATLGISAPISHDVDNEQAKYDECETTAGDSDNEAKDLQSNMLSLQFFMIVN